MSSLPDLNEAQRAAVEHGAGPALVIAGAGSGKTRVLTARVAHLLARGIAPEAILAFTFTNRAAREMRARIERTVGEAARRLWVGTFHATGVRILRREARGGALPGIGPDFVIYDREDQETVVAAAIAALELPEGTLRTGEVLRRISDAKNALVSVEAFERAAVSPHERRIAACYRRYRDTLRGQSALDFDDLIGDVVTLLRDRPEIAERYRRRFVHVLVDEYQDTNHAQFRLVEALAAGHGNLFVVGDDDQSIYRFRGADLTNVLEFERAFPGAAVIRLEQNYRSTANILRAANAVIAHNRDRKGKTLWCDREDGARLRFVLAADEADEARCVRARLEEHRRRGGRLDECAILYRTNAQSRALESELRLHGIRYEMVGGVSFFARREVKDLLAYLRLALNPADRVAFWRVWNTPRRGLGDAVRARIEALGDAPPLEALRSLAGEGLRGAARGGAESFITLIDELRAGLNAPPAELLRLVLERTDYLRMLDDERDGTSADRRANIEELLVAASDHASAPADDGSGDVAGFLAEATLVTDADRVEEGADRVLMLTAHTAKGLEFPVVIVAGLEEGLFPHGSSLDEPGQLEEERRLFYVAVTRARNEVLLTAAAYRRRFTAEGVFAARGGAVSRFVDEIPAELVDREETLQPAVRFPAWASRRRAGAAGPAQSDGPAYRTRGPLARVVGKEVYHETFGRGVVVMAEGAGPDARYTVRFGTQLKKVMGRFLTGGVDVD
ncbi:MAG: UvrD-helicase domain-containing protein [Candidatus Eisenbacteria bacterium]|uniref:DNA 3'-5' helicase n=1 Tax=Eiseniibacteriota bacterium TaxID=2212470 RepID=A0A9D6L7U9_UNCEI|nr:UvrD-helicase domain-containing protein [Candidatus Eisenbacteria bacterium]MBI3539220.1 UvrD-helicase domain-containing protein [Candidatus Eisenbacteria bacterium]